MKTDFTQHTDMTEAQRAKLPAYAKDYIAWLERKVHETEHTLYEETSRLGPRVYMNGKITDERHEPQKGIIIAPNGQHPLAIHENHTVRFWIPGKWHERYIDVRFMDRTPGPGIEIMGAQSLEFIPSSSNMAYVRIARW